MRLTFFYLLHMVLVQRFVHDIEFRTLKHMGSSILTLPYLILEMQALDPAGSRSWKFQIRLLNPSAAARSKTLPHNQLNLSRKRDFYISWRDSRTSAILCSSSI